MKNNIDAKKLQEENANLKKTIEDLWTQFTLDLRRRKDATRFLKSSNELLKTLGTYIEVKDTGLEEKDDRVEMTFDILFEKGQRKADVHLVWNDGRWYVSHFEIEGLSLN